MSSVSVGIVGLPNSGKSTLFNALLQKQVADAQNYPFTTIEPNVGIVEVADSNLKKLEKVVEESEGISNNFKVIPAVVKFVDIAGLVKGAHKGEGLGNRFLSYIREVDAIIFVLRDFENEDIIKTGVSPREDLDVLKSELFLKDLESIDKILETLSKELRGAKENDSRHKQFEILGKAKEMVSAGKWLGEELNGEELKILKDSQLLTSKKSIVVLNSSEKDLGKESDISGSLRICARLEEEISLLDLKEQKEYLAGLNVKFSALEVQIK